MAHAKSHPGLRARVRGFREARRHLFETDFATGEASISRRLAAGVVIFAEETRESELLTRAGAIAYTFLLSLIPLVSLSLAFFTALPGLSEARGQLQSWLFRQLLPETVQSVRSYVEAWASNAATAGTISTLAFLVTVLLVFQTVEEAMNRIFRSPCDRTWGQRLRALATFFLVGAIAAAALVALARAASGVSHHVASFAAPGLVAFVLELGNLGVSIAAFAIANAVVPNARVTAFAAVAGGAVAGTLWYATKSLFGWYVDGIASYESVYGALSVIPAFFLWVYVSHFFLLVGAQVAFVVQHFDALAARRRTTTEARAYYAVAVAAAFAGSFRAGEGPIDSLTVAERLHLAPYFASEAVGTLARAGVLVSVPGHGGLPRYVLRRPSETLTVEDVVACVTHDALELPDLEAAAVSPSAVRIGTLFERARANERDLLGSVTLAELEIPPAPG